MELRLPTGAGTVAAHLALGRATPERQVPGVVLAHGFPTGPPPADGNAADPGASLCELADRITNEMHWCALAISARGCGTSDGDFSLDGWFDDQQAAVTYLLGRPEVWGVWIVGFGTGGALALAVAAGEPGVRGVATLAAPADFNDWAAHPRRLLGHARQQGIINTPGYPPATDRWAAQLRRHNAADVAPRVADRPLLVVHGADDDIVPVFDARVLADAHGDAELRIIDGASHQLRDDPRAVATLLGWLDRQRNLSIAS